MLRLATITLLSLALAACSSDDSSSPTPQNDMGSETSTVEITLRAVSSGMDGLQIGLDAQPDEESAKVEVLNTNDVVFEEFDWEFGTDETIIEFTEPAEPFYLELTTRTTDGSILRSGRAQIVRDDMPIPERLSVQVVAERGFAPVIALIASQGNPVATETRFDYRNASDRWLGRFGHVAVSLEDGRVLVAGGMSSRGAPPIDGSASDLLDDIQFLDPATGYLTAATGVGLSEPVVHATAIRSGDEIYVIGGFTSDGASTAIQVIDVGNPDQIQMGMLQGSSGNPVALNEARARHTAVYRSGSGDIVVAGGLGSGGADDILDTYEVIKPSGEVLGPFPMVEARVDHAAVYLPDSDITWVVGGRNTNGILATTETFAADSSAASTTLDEARYGLTATQTLERTVIVGGFTDLESTASTLVEFGAPDSLETTTLNNARGYHQAVNYDGRILLFGGSDADSNVYRSEEISFENGSATVTTTDAMEIERFMPTATVSGNRQVVLIGGFGEFQGNDIGLDTASYYNPGRSLP